MYFVAEETSKDSNEVVNSHVCIRGVLLYITTHKSETCVHVRVQVLHFKCTEQQCTSKAVQSAW